MSRFCFPFAAALCVVAASPAFVRAQDTPPPATPVTPASPTAATVTPDPKAIALLEKAQAKMLATKTLSATVEELSEGKNAKGETARSYTLVTSRLMKPNFFNVTMKYGSVSPDGKKVAEPGGITFASNGKTAWSVFDKTYRTQPATDPKRLYYGVLLPLEGFFSATKSPRAMVTSLMTRKELSECASVGEEVWNGDRYDVVVVQRKGVYENEPMYYAYRYYIGADGFIRRVKQAYKFGDKPEVTHDYQVTKLVAETPMKAAAFAYAPPKGALSQAEVEAKQPKLLTAGTVAPDFSVVDKNGKAVKLSDYRGKIVVLDFWATWCGPCIASLPHTNTVAKKLADKGVVTLAVNVWDKKEAVDKWLPENEKKYDGVTFLLDTSEGGQAIATPLYHVSGIPTQYIIDRDGKIRQSLVGFGGETPALENAIAEADKPMKPAAPVAKKAGR